MTGIMIKLITQARLIKRTLVTPLNTPFKGTSNNSRKTNIKIVGSINLAASLPTLGEAKPSIEPRIMANSKRLVECVNRLIVFDRRLFNMSNFSLNTALAKALLALAAGKVT